MNKYIVVYHAPGNLMEQVASMSPEEIQKGMEPWHAWMEARGDALVDGGTPLAGGQNISESGWTSSDREVTGYSILQAEDMESAKAMLDGHPHLDWAKGAEIEVHEMMPMSM